MFKTHLMSAAGLCLCATGALAQVPVLTIYTYDSFVSEWGPGPAIEAAFEAECNCDLQFVGNGDGAALLARVMLEGPRTDADIVLGLDTSLIARARQLDIFADHGVLAAFDLPVAWDDPQFLPYDWGYFAFVSTADVEAPTSIAQLADSDLKIVIQDPRSSTPGLGLLMWVQAAYPDDSAAIWEALADNIVTVTPGWSEAYGMFLEGEADAVLSYTTSPAYHIFAEDDQSKVAWAFEEGHYTQIEVAAKLAGTDQPELADQFMQFITSDAFQSAIPRTNWMYPAITPQGGLPDEFQGLARPQTALLFTPDEAAAVLDGALEEWRAALSQ